MLSHAFAFLLVTVPELVVAGVAVIRNKTDGRSFSAEREFRRDARRRPNPGAHRL